MIACERERRGVRFDCYWNDLWKADANNPDCGIDILPRLLPLPSRDAGEFIQDLDADHSAPRQGCERRPALLDVEEALDENVRVEEGPHRSFASSRSNV